MVLDGTVVTPLKCAPMDRMKELRNAAGLSRRELSEKTGISERALEYIEHGTKSPRVDNAVKIARALGVGLEDLFADSAA